MIERASELCARTGAATIGPAALGLALSRPIATANRLGQDAPDRHRFSQKRVLLTGDAAALATANGRVILLNALRLLVRICPDLTLRLSGAPKSLIDEAKSEAARVAFGQPVCFEADGRTDQFDAVLSVGGRAVRPGWTAVASNGWVVRVDSVNGADLGAMSQRNAVGAVAAASLGVAEVFKKLVGLKPARGLPADGTPFSLYTYESGDNDPGPPLPEVLQIDALLVGFGAIGNGVGAVLRELPIRGRLMVIDRQSFGPENLGTCVLIGEKDVTCAKVEVAKALITSSGGLCVVPLEGDVETLLPKLTSVPPLVLNALDNRNARRAVQTLWADVTVDGAIGDFMAQVSRHPGDPALDVACLRCLYPPDVGPSADIIAAQASGLRVERIRDAEDVVNQEDVECAPPEKREELRARLGTKICSVTSAAVLAAISSGQHAEDFEPSVPFVATISGAMVAGEAVKVVAGLPSPLEPRFQFSTLTGPSLGLDFPEVRSNACQCTARRDLIERFRASRAGDSR